MPLYLDELWLNWADVDACRRSLDAFAGLGDGSFNFPPGVRMVAGPWFSNEDSKIVFVLDIADHTDTFVSFSLGVAHGLIQRRRLTPIVEWKSVLALRDVLGSGAG